VLRVPCHSRFSHELQAIRFWNPLDWTLNKITPPRLAICPDKTAARLWVKYPFVFRLAHQLRSRIEAPNCFGALPIARLAEALTLSAATRLDNAGSWATWRRPFSWTRQSCSQTNQGGNQINAPMLWSKFFTHPLKTRENDGEYYIVITIPVSAPTS
jgi:hypothetical protein